MLLSYFQRLRRKGLGNFLRLIKPTAANPAVFIDPLDCHAGTARLQPDNIARLKGGIHSSLSPLCESPNRDSFTKDDITLVAKAESFEDARERPLQIGDIVQLNSGSHRMLVVDADANQIVTAWYVDDGDANEATFPRPCCHRVSPL